MEDSTGNIDKELFLEQEACPEQVQDRKTEDKKHRKADGWWKTPEGQKLIEELSTRYSDDVRAESKHTGRYDHVPFIVRCLRLYPEDDILKAALWYENKGRGGSLKANYHAGLLYEIGHDYLRAAVCFTKAANGDIMHEASFHLGLLYENGLLTDGPDIPSAIRWYRRGAMGMDRFSEASTDALKRLGVINCWAELGYDHSLMIQKRKRTEEAAYSPIKHNRTDEEEGTERTVQMIKKGFNWEKIELGFMMIVILPCLAVSECCDWARFKWSSKYRKKVYRNLKKDKNRLRRGLIKPEGDDNKWRRNNESIVRQIYTNEGMYPECRLSILVPQCYDLSSEKFILKNFWSVKVPGKFHCWDMNNPESLKELDFLQDYMNRNGLVDAAIVIHDDSTVYERIRRFHFWDDELYCESIELSCHVELLTLKNPESDLNFEKVPWHVIELPEAFRLERGSLTSLDDRSERIFKQYKERICKNQRY